MDIFEPLPGTERGNWYVLVIAEYFTKWKEGFPMSYMEAHTVAELTILVCCFGAPDYLHTDQGRNFESTLLTEICKLIGVVKTRTTPYHPQSNRLVERFNHMLLNMLSIAAQDRERNWDLQLPLLTMAYRTSVQESKGATPFSLMFGREARLPIDVIFGLPPGEESVSPSHYTLLLRQRMEAAYHHVRSQLSLQQVAKVAGAPYCVGDLVWLHSPAVAWGSSQKLHCPWKGPYRITKVITEVTYRVQQMRPPRRRIVFHYNCLKPYHGQCESTTPAPPETVRPTDQSDPVTPPDYEDELVVVYPSSPVQTSPKLSL